MPRKGLIGRAFLISFFESDVPLVFCGLFRSMDEEEGDEEKASLRLRDSTACERGVSMGENIEDCSGALHGRCRLINRDPDVYMVRVPFMNISTSETNVYIVKDGDEALVVDTGAPTDKGAVVLSEAFEILGIDPSKASFFLTHLHMDHAGLVDRLVPREAPLYVNKTDFDLMNASKEPEFWKRMELRMLEEGLGTEKTRLYCQIGHYGIGIDSFDAAGRDVRFVDEGDSLFVGRHEFKVVSTAGHTPGHQSLFHELSGLFFVGDHVLFVISPGLGFRPDRADAMAVYLGNVEKMLGMDISCLLVSHGELKDGWRERCEWLIAHHKKRMERAVEVTRMNPGISGVEIIRNLNWNVPKDWDAISPAQKWCILESGIIILEHQTHMGTIAREKDDQGIYRYHVAK